MDFVIDRSKWRCGGSGPHMQGTGPTELLNNDGFMCCLGQVCKQLGVPESKMLNVPAPLTLVHRSYTSAESLHPLGYIVEAGVLAGTALTQEAMSCNDNPYDSMRPEDREQTLTELFARNGHTLTFVGSYHEPVHSVPTCVPDRSL